MLFLTFIIENKVESGRHVKVRLFTVRTNPTPGASANMEWGVSEQCWMYHIFWGVSLNSRTSPILFVLCSNKPHMNVIYKILYLELTS